MVAYIHAIEGKLLSSYMATRMVTLDERASHLEGKIDSLATKEDVANLRVEISQMETRLIKWMVGTVLAGMALAASLTIALQNLLSG